MYTSEMSIPVDNPVHYSKPYSWMIDQEVSHVKSKENEVIVILEIFTRVFFGQTTLNLPGWLIQ
jgi:hypothetical protein